jgi:hypothetical protein
MNSPLNRLGELGADYRDPMRAIDWDSCDVDLPWLPHSMLSLGGAEEELPADVLVQLSRIEFARICAAGLWVEGLLISKISTLGYPKINIDEARVMMSEVREEAGHGLMFLKMIQRAGLENVPLLGSTWLLTAIARMLPARSAEFWALVYIGESVTDTFAVKALQQSLTGNNEICPLVRQVLSFHHRDEARHIAAARALLEMRVAALTSSRKAAVAAGLKWLLPRFIDATLYPTEASLASLGLNNPGEQAVAARKCPKRRAMVHSYSASACKFLSGLGLGEVSVFKPSLFSKGRSDELA